MTIPLNVPRAVVDLDRPRTITLQLSALKRIREATGSLDIDLAEDAIFERAPEIIWAALIDEDREGLTPDDVRGMIHAGNLASVIESLSGLVVSSTPKGAEGNGHPAPGTKRRKAAK